MRARVETLLGRERAQELDLHLPQLLRAGPAARGRGGRPVARLRDLRRGRPAGRGEGGAEGPRPLREAAPAARLLVADLGAQERGPGAAKPGDEDGQDRRPSPWSRSATRRRWSARRPWTSTTSCCGPWRLLRERGGPRGLPASLSLRAGGRVPGHEPRPVRAHPPPRGDERQPDRGRRRGPVDLLLAGRRHPEHPGLRARLPGGAGVPPGAELPIEPGHPGCRGRAGGEQPAAQGQDPARGQGGGGAGRISTPPPTSTRRRPSSWTDFPATGGGAGRPSCSA